MRRALIAIAGFAVACNVDPRTESTGGTSIPSGPCGRGIVVVQTDYQSSNVSLVSLDGDVLSASIVSSAAEVSGLSLPLGGDVVLPSTPRLGASIVLIDRFPSAVLTFVEVESGRPSAQLSLSTGFSSNPHDYVEVSADKAYATRFDVNFDPGREAFDAGGDVLVLDPEGPTIRGRIDLSEALQGAAPGLLPRPDRAVVVSELLFVVVQSIDAGYSASGIDRFVTIDVATDQIVDVLELEGLAGCNGLGLSPSADRVVLGCTGGFSNGEPNVNEAGLVVLSIDSSSPVEVGRFPASEIGGRPVGFSVALASEKQVLFPTLGSLDPRTDDTITSLDLTTGELTVLRRGEPFSLGEVACAADCGVCFFADAATDGGVVVRVSVDESGQPSTRRDVRPDGNVGLPARYIGRF